MIKDLAEDLILIALVILAGFLAWKYYFRDLILSGADKAKAVIKEYAEDTKTVAQAASYPLDVVADLFRSARPYISQADQAAAIAKIKANLAGKMG